ncbi:hypothetical protein Tco_0756736 [Tanacetum coccineum]
MSSYNQRECVGCGQPCDGFYCYLCTCQLCGVNLINGICLNCTYGDGKPVTCCGCEGPLNGGFCSFCASRAGNSFAYDPNPNSFDDSQNLSDYPPQPQYQTYSCEFCGNDARYGHYCTPQVPIISNPEPCYNQNYDEFPQTLPSFQQQILCCENCGGPHATFECQPMNQNFHDSNSSGFDQFQPLQFSVIHQPPQEMGMEALQAREDLMKSIQNFLKKFNRISFRETPKVLMQAWEKFFEVKHAQSEEVQELLNKLLQNLQSINEELAEYINTPKTESDEFIKSSVENLVQNPRESEDECECDVPDCDDSQMTNFSTFSNPLFDDSTSSDDESSHEEVIHEMSFKTYSNPLFDLDKEIISSEFNSIHNEDLDSTPKNDPGELITIPPRIVNREHEEYISLMEMLLYDNSSPRSPEDFHANPNTIIDLLLSTHSYAPKNSNSLRGRDRYIIPVR